MEKVQLQLKEENLIDSFTKVKQHSKYGCELTTITDFFKKYPKNTDFLTIAAKVAIIDTTNSTNIARYKKDISLCDITKIILEIESFDDRVEKGDPLLVSEIAQKAKKLYNKNLFSFASKYCCYHNSCIYGKDDYSIYDGIVGTYLPLFATAKHPLTKYQIEKWRTEINYVDFNNYIGDLLDEYGIHISMRRRIFDYFIWFNMR